MSDSTSRIPSTKPESKGEAIERGVQIISEYLALLKKGGEFEKGSPEREANLAEAKAWMRALPDEAGFYLFLLKGFVDRLDSHIVHMQMDEGRLGDSLMKAARVLDAEKGNEELLGAALFLDMIAKAATN